MLKLEMIFCLCRHNEDQEGHCICCQSLPIKSSRLRKTLLGSLGPPFFSLCVTFVTLRINSTILDPNMLINLAFTRKKIFFFSHPNNLPELCDVPFNRVIHRQNYERGLFEDVNTFQLFVEHSCFYYSFCLHRAKRCIIWRESKQHKSCFNFMWRLMTWYMFLLCSY